MRGYDHSLSYRSIMQYNDCTLAVKGISRLGELEFSTFITGRSCYGNGKTILHNTYFDMDSYPLARLDFVTRSGLLPKERLITPVNIKYLHGSCEKTMARKGGLFDEDTLIRNRPFPDHPFQVRMDEAMQAMADSVKAVGIQTPAVCVKKRTGNMRLSAVTGASRKTELAQKRKILSEAQKRMDDLDTLIRRIYEDNVLSKLPDARYLKLSAEYERE